MLGMTAWGPLCDIHRCPLYGRFRGHSGHQPSELSARPPSLAVSLPVALLGGLDLGGLLLLELALALLGLGDGGGVDRSLGLRQTGSVATAITSPAKNA